jgi:hypothetical protein
MDEDLAQTWSAIAHALDDWGPPLRRSPADTAITCNAIGRWCTDNRKQAARVFLCGVTPEIALMPWPCRVELLGMDRVESMVRAVWPGDVPGVRTAVVGDWLAAGVPPGSMDIVVGDGGFGFFDYPDGQRALAQALGTMLQPDGLLVYRGYAQAAGQEPLSDVIGAARARQVGSFHAFKWRVAMAVQRSSRDGVRLHDVWQACTDAGIDSAQQPQPGWSDRAVRTIRFYKDSDARLYFPTVNEFRDLLNETFDVVNIQFPHYELGERCPHFAARPRRRAGLPFQGRLR